MACCLLHNYVRRMIPVDPLKEELDRLDHTHTTNNNDPITQIKASDEWNTWRTTMAN
jgi:hypothetical protein